MDNSIPGFRIRHRIFRIKHPVLGRMIGYAIRITFFFWMIKINAIQAYLVYLMSCSY